MKNKLYKKIIGLQIEDTRCFFDTVSSRPLNPYLDIPLPPPLPPPPPILSLKRRRYSDVQPGDRTEQINPYVSQNTFDIHRDIEKFFKDKDFITIRKQNIQTFYKGRLMDLPVYARTLLKKSNIGGTESHIFNSYTEQNRFISEQLKCQGQASFDSDIALIKGCSGITIALEDLKKVSIKKEMNSLQCIANSK